VLVIVPANRRCLNDYVRKCTFYVGDNPIKFLDSFVHLGHVITHFLADNDDILRRRNEFIGQVNNVLCFFSKLKSCIVYTLLQLYCMGLYGCELCLLSNIHIEELCVSWRKSLRRIWRLPYKTHCYLLPLLSECLSLEDEICRRSLNCICECLCNSSRLATAPANCEINYGCCNSVLGLNAMFCSNKFNVNISNKCGGVVNVRRAVDQ